MFTPQILRDLGPTQHFGENKNQDHANEQPRLLGRASDTGITDDADRKPSGKTSQADGKTGAELDESGVQRVLLLLQAVGDEHRHDETVDLYAKSSESVWDTHDGSENDVQQ